MLDLAILDLSVTESYGKAIDILVNDAANDSRNIASLKAFYYLFITIKNRFKIASKLFGDTIQ